MWPRTCELKPVYYIKINRFPYFKPRFIPTPVNSSPSQLEQWPNGICFCVFQIFLLKNMGMFIYPYHSNCVGIHQPTLVYAGIIFCLQESNQRCAAEITAGLIRGSKHWPFRKVCSILCIWHEAISTEDWRQNCFRKELCVIKSYVFHRWFSVRSDCQNVLLDVLSNHVETLKVFIAIWPENCSRFQLANLWDFIVPVIKKALDNITVETLRDWGTCMATAAVSCTKVTGEIRDAQFTWYLYNLFHSQVFSSTIFLHFPVLLIQESRDPRRIYRLLDLLMDDPLSGSGGAFADSR